MAKKILTISEIVQFMAETFNQIMRENIYEANLSRKSYEMLEARKRKLRLALRECAVGDAEAKGYVKDLIQDILVEKLKITKKNIDEVIPFANIDMLSAWDCFQILLAQFEKSYGKDAMTKLLLFGGFQDRRIIREEDIKGMYLSYMPVLSFLDKLDVLTQRVFCLYRGLGIADDIREMNIDGISGGVSGTDASNKSLWIFWKGKSVNLAFLKFGSERELERICNNIYRYNQPGQLSRSRGYIVNDMKDHSRVVVARPPFCESWVFFVRKFNKETLISLDSLYGQTNHETAERLLAALVKGCQTCAITGSQGCGKTTLLMSLVAFIPPFLNLRIQELAFELHLRDIYPERNIVTFRETESISGQEGLDLQKKTDGGVNILGEVATAPVAGYMLQMGLVASLFTLFTHHARNTEALISSMANALLSENIYQDESAARMQVAQVIRFDIHLGMDGSGSRYVEYVNEIVPLPCRNRFGQEYEVHRLLWYDTAQKAYVMDEKVQPHTVKEMLKWFSDEEKEAFINEFA